VAVMPSVAAAAMAAEKTEAQTARININTASAVELQTLPGIGEVLSARIVDYREEHGAFAQIEDIKNVYGIGDGIFSNIQARITVGAATVRAEEDDDR
ncbi:MAG: helix-hairpin-helix domain-containing protein, partial [Oscillospiraceae bacterium]|nr:helix-hairpin-helix domain-containing protein [Oscillospiraceae bacterium]